MTYVLNRLLSVILTLFLITLVTFAITNILPGDVAMMIMGTQSNPEALAGLRDSLGLNDPLLVQYGRWVAGMLTGDWGDSLIFKKPIAELLSQKIMASSIIVAMSTARLRFPLFSPAQNRLRPLSVTGHRPLSRPPRIRSNRMTSAPICARVMPARGAATKADPSTIRKPSRILTMVPPGARRFRRRLLN
jgi:nucleoside recognition membrane protein YjiH